VLDNLRWGVRWGLWYASAFSAWVLVLSVIHRSVRWPKYGMTTWGIVGTYYLAALVVGPTVGALRPLANSRIGTFALGWIAGTLGYSLVAFTMGALTPWWIWAIPGLGFGGVALVMQDRSRGEVRTNWRFIAIVAAIAAVLALWMHFLGWW